MCWLLRFDLSQELSERNGARERFGSSSSARSVMEAEVVPVYGNGWFDVISQQPMPTPKPFTVAVTHNAATIVGRIQTSGHEFEGYYVILRHRYKDDQTDYDVEVVNRPTDGLAWNETNIVCNGYAVVTTPRRPTIAS